MKDEKLHGSSTEPSTKSTHVIPVIHEQMHVHKELVETGKVHIRKTVTEQTAGADIPVMHEEYDIKRVPVNKIYESPPPALSYEGETMVIPVIREVIEVIKRYEVVEEVRVTKKAVTETERHEMKLRVEEVHVERRSTSDHQR
jgi:uncharacterized protein (TIGR02271 family)